MPGSLKPVSNAGAGSLSIDITQQPIAMAGGRVFCIDSHSPEDIGAMKRRGIDTAGLASTLLAINDRTGAEVWKKIVNDPPAVMDSTPFYEYANS